MKRLREMPLYLSALGVLLTVILFVLGLWMSGVFEPHGRRVRVEILEQSPLMAVYDTIGSDLACLYGDDQVHSLSSLRVRFPNPGDAGIVADTDVVSELTLRLVDDDARFLEVGIAEAAAPNSVRVDQEVSCDQSQLVVAFDLLNPDTSFDISLFHEGPADSRLEMTGRIRDVPARDTTTLVSRVSPDGGQRRPGTAEE